MDVRLSTEQQALHDSAARVVDDLGPHTVGSLDDSGRTTKLDAAIDAAGWRELRMAMDDGSPLASGVEVAIIAEELGRGLADVPFLGPALAAELRRLAGSPPANSRETVLLSRDLTTLATDGTAIDATGIETALAVEPTTAGHRLMSVPIALIDERVDLTQHSARPKPGADGDPVDGHLDPDALIRWTALGLTITCADLVGVMTGAVRLACDYVSERQQYGVAVGSFQAVQHLLADALVATEGSRSLTLYAAWAVDALPADEAHVAAAMAKAYSARAARTVCETVIQTHGGIGNTWECLAHVYLRRAMASAAVLGGVGPSVALVLASHGIGDDDGLR